MHSKHSRITIRSAVKSAFTHQCVTHRSIHTLHECLQLLACTGKHCASANKNIWLLRFADHMYRFLDISLIKGACLRLRNYRFLPCILYFVCSHILGDINKYRARSVLSRDRESAADRIRKLRHILDNKTVFRNRSCNTCNINLLKTVLTEKRYPNVTCDCDHRNRIHVSGRNTRNKVGCSRSGSCHTDTNLAGTSCISVCRMGCSLLMGCQHMLDLRMLIQFIVYI